MRLSIKADEVMSYFCWAYTNALLKKLLDLTAANRIFEEEEDKATFGSVIPQRLTTISYQVLSELGRQLPFRISISKSMFPEDIKKIISAGLEYIEIFSEVGFSVDLLKFEITKIILDNPNPEKSSEKIIEHLRSKYGLS